MAKTYIDGVLVSGIPTTDIVKVTQAQYDALTTAQQNSGNYLITDAPDTIINASEVKYGDSNVGSALDGKSNTGHTHDDRYYTESEMNTLLADKDTKLSNGSRSLYGESIFSAYDQKCHFLFPFPGNAKQYNITCSGINFAGYANISSSALSLSIYENAILVYCTTKYGADYRGCWAIGTFNITRK